MTVDATLTLAGVDLNQPSPADVTITFTRIADANANLVAMTFTAGDTDVAVQLTAEDLQELGRKVTLILP